MVDERIPLSKTLIDLRIKELELEEKARVIAELKSRQDDAAVAELAEKLQEDSWHLRELTVRGLSEMGRQVEYAVVALLPGSLWYTRSCVAEVLGNVRSIVGIGPLIDLLDDANSSVRDSASKALAKICAGGEIVWVARASVSKGEDAVKRLRAILEKHRREIVETFLSMTRDAELMKAPADQVEKMVEARRAAGGSHDVVWEELTGKKESMAEPAGEKGLEDDSGTDEGGGEAGEHRGM